MGKPNKYLMTFEDGPLNRRPESESEGPGSFEEYTYLSSVETCYRNRRFPVEIIRPGRYMKIKSKYFGLSQNSTSMAVIETLYAMS